ncbi:beta-lactamase-like protein [Cantharellus anzutake]|uniref:beta-lactamase-like protein n=1 Tax=Cantharellus anzutake TaxID=1750568 RepID=UPI0019075E3A|nr:beta-lactamase-like protein [Cantharellus anzutake]KAF8337555.1 beta-lactamase-like protein [Cantharellus anzutake]
MYRRLLSPISTRSLRRNIVHTASRKMLVIPVPVRSDNYAYLLVDESTKKAAAVDPYDVKKVDDAALEAGVHIEAIITTHHHHDHSGGNEEFVRKHPGTPVYGGSKQITALTKQVKDKDEFTLGNDIKISCLATPCHTQDSISFFFEDAKTGQKGVFTGDTLFIAGCGRFFEGTAEDMHNSLSYLGTLPDDTVVYNGHEYTTASAAFGAHVDPKNEAVQQLRRIAKEGSCTTGKSTIGDEKNWNVFMRLDSPAVQDFTSSKDPIASLVKLREAKNVFRG